MNLPAGIKPLLAAAQLVRVASAGVLAIAGLQVYTMTGRELDLGFLGLAGFLPVLIMAPLAGAIADRYDRRLVWGVGVALEAFAAAGVGWYVSTSPTAVGPVFGLMGLFGAASALIAPAARSLPVDLSPPDSVARVIALRSVTFQVGSIVGPLGAAWLFERWPHAPYLAAAALYAAAIVGMLFIVRPPVGPAPPAVLGARERIREAFQGLGFIRRSPIVFGAISLDLFAVLFGGAVALLPAIAEKLGAGPIGFGWLRAAIGIGATATALFLAVRPVRRKVGKVLLLAVTIFGVGTIVLGATSSYVVAFAALLVASAADAVSVFIRSTLVPLATPPEMRGRVLAVENVFIGGSNELGAVESGVVGELLGVTWAVVTGGIATLAIAALWWRRFPVLRDADRFEEVAV